MRGKWSGLYIWPLIFLLSKGRVIRKCGDCGARACPVMTFGDEKQLHVGCYCK